MSEEIYKRFAAIAREVSPMLADAIANTGPVELLPRRDSPFPEYLCRAIAGQQLSVKAAATIWNRVVERAGDRPFVEYIARAEPSVLRACGLSAAKTKAMGAIAAATSAGQLDVEELETLEAGDRTKRLTAIWGVGPWTADMANIFYFGEPDIWPDGDAAARKTLERLTGPQRKTQGIAARFAPHRSYLALYMWRCVDSTPT